MIENSLIEEILHKADIVDVISSYINVIKKGRNYVCVCPFHDDKNPSMMISKDKQIFKCFVCGTGGNVITFVQKYEKIGFEEAVRKVASIINFTDERLTKTISKPIVNSNLVPLYSAINDLVKYYEYALTTDEGTKAFEYLEKRNLGKDICDAYHIGYAFMNGKETIEYLKRKGHSLKSIEGIGVAGNIGGNFQDHNAGRVIFPIMDCNGQVIGFSARRLSDDVDEPKYVNSPETPLFKKNNILFNYHMARQTAKRDGYIYVLEGFMDIFALVKAGITSCVALMGTAMTSNHIAMLRQLGAQNVEIRMCLDGDNPGQTATMKICRLLDKEGLRYRIVLTNNDERDPDEIYQESGKVELINYLNNLVNKAEFALQYYCQTNALTSVDDKKKLIADFLPILVSTKDRLELDDYILKLAQVTGFQSETIRDLLNDAKKANKTQDFDEVVQEFHPEKRYLRRFALAEKEILYHMLTNEEAVKFYENKINNFYEDIYDNVANYIVEYYETEHKVDMNMILTQLDQEDTDESREVRDKIASLSLEKHHPDYSEQLMNECKDVIDCERQKEFDQNTIKEAIAGKDPIEQAKIIDEFYQKKKN